MNFREINRKKNLALRSLKARIGKFLFDKRNQNTFIPSKIKEIRKIIYLRNDGKLGDMIISSISFREMKKLLPSAQITVIAAEQTKELAETNPNINSVYIYKRSFFSIIKLGIKLRRENPDLYIDMDEANTIETLLLLRLINPKFALGFNREKFKLYNINIPFRDKSAHITDWHKAVFERLGLINKAGKFDKQYDVFIPEQVMNTAKKFISKLPEAKKNIIFNMFAASYHKSFCAQQLLNLAKELTDFNIILVGRYNDIEKIKKELLLPGNVFYPSKSDYQTCGFSLTSAIIKMSDFVITPDTSIVHISSAFNKPTIAVYNSNMPYLTEKWRPMSDKTIIINTKEDFNKLDIREMIENVNSCMTN
ncbi:MAG: glycosyltransferase family 9 protein [Elusimicrobiota bacterium]|jgi:ADP-heptose:LPS heptosyltransferase|nr:glycosyltransferase family 9 protein [Elusimicrobiota bacterium]